MPALVLLAFISCSSITEKSSSVSVIKCGHLFDSISGTWKKNQILLIEEGRIREVNPEKIPSDAALLDFTDHFIVPGLIDSHTHLFLEDETFGQDMKLGLLNFVNEKSVRDREELGVQRGRSLLKAGFTSVRDLGNQGKVDIEKIKKLTYLPRIFSSGPGFTPSLGQFPPGTSQSIIHSEYLFYTDPLPSTDLIKVYADEDPNEMVTSPANLTKVINAAHAEKKKVASHASLTSAIDHSIEAGADTIEHGIFITDKQLQTMSEKSIIFVPTLADSLFLDPKLSSVKRSHAEGMTIRNCQNIRKAKARHVQIAFGSDNFFSLEKFGFSFGEATMRMLIEMEKCGLTRNEVLMSATSIAAKTAGREDEIGSLKKGAYADFIVLKKDPRATLLSLFFPHAVYKSGKPSKE